MYLDLPLLIPPELITQGNTLEADAGVELVEADAHLSKESVVQFVDDTIDLVHSGLEITAAVGVIEQDVALAANHSCVTRIWIHLGRGIL